MDYNGDTALFIAFSYREYIPKSKSTMLVSSYYIDGQIFYKATNNLCKRLNEMGYEACVDSDINIKALAEANGVGFCGYNTLLAIKGLGSRTYLSVLRTSAKVEKDDEFDDGIMSVSCDKCRKCVENCPNGAISENGEFIYTKCLRHYMFSSSLVPRDVLPLFGNRFLGCDECQRCCPVNGKRFENMLYYPDDLENALSVEGILSDSQEGLKERISVLKSYLGKNYITKMKVLRATLIVAGNIGTASLLPIIKGYLTSDDELIREYAHYAYNRILENSK